MSFLRARAQAVNAHFKQVEKARLAELIKCFRTAYGSETPLPREFVIENDECLWGTDFHSFGDKAFDEKLEAGLLAKSSVEILDLVVDFQGTPQCTKRSVFSKDKWDDVSMLQLQELKRWAKTELYVAKASIHDLESLYRRTDFLGELVKHAELIFFSPNGSVNDAHRTLLRHIRSHVLEERVLPQVILELERQAKAKQIAQAGLGGGLAVAAPLVPLALPVGGVVHLRVPLMNRWLAVKDRVVLMVEHRSMASAFLIHSKVKKGVKCYGFMEVSSKEFLFSSRPMTSMFHRQYGQDYLYCRYKVFKGGEKFVLFRDPAGILEDAGVLQSFYNSRFAGAEIGSARIRMVKDVADALLLSLCLVDG